MKRKMPGAVSIGMAQAKWESFRRKTAGVAHHYLQSASDIVIVT
jgi:hypothetical protein